VTSTTKVDDAGEHDAEADSEAEVTADAAADEPEEKPPLLERLAVAYFRSRSASMPEVESSDAVHHLSDDERRALTRIQRMTVLRAFMIGGLSAAAAGTFELFAMPAMGIYDADDLGQKAIYWAWLGSVAGIAAVFEIGFLYWDALRSVHELARTAGVQMFKDPKKERSAVTAALARAALEIPNSKRAVLGVDPQREIVKWKLVVVTLAYKAKIGLVVLRRGSRDGRLERHDRLEGHAGGEDPRDGTIRGRGGLRCPPGGCWRLVGPSPPQRRGCGGREHRQNEGHAPQPRVPAARGPKARRSGLRRGRR
jgi:hypothetical protein